MRSMPFPEMTDGFGNINHENGPVVFSLIDLHVSNIFVDPDWIIKCLY
jgi:hypothetical protein